MKYIIYSLYYLPYIHKYTKYGMLKNKLFTVHFTIYYLHIL